MRTRLRDNLVLSGYTALRCLLLTALQMPVWSQTPAPAHTRVEAITRLEIAPSTIRLTGSHARQQMLVTEYRPDGSAIDLTESARFEVSGGSAVQVNAQGVALPVRDGTAVITVHVGSQTVRVTASAQAIHKPALWTFENHVEAVLSKQGCNMGICHGAASGKGGFRLSLRAYDPAADYERLRYEGRARRITLAAPTDSLLLQKPALRLAHYGGLRLKRDSLEYRVLSEWITSGAFGPHPNTPRLLGIDVLPRTRVLLPRATQRLLVTARFSDGHTEDVTHWAKYSSNEETIATVDDTGRVAMRTAGETAISVWYLGKVTFARLSVPFPNRVDLARYNILPRANFIDAHVYAKLAPLRLWPSQDCTDAEFVRRATLDAIGLLPTPQETRAFLADTRPDKRAKWIDSLLSRPEYVDLWTYRWCDLLRVNRDVLGSKGMWSFYNWLHTSIAANKGWDQIAREIVTAQGTASSYGPVNFYRMGSRPEEFAETVSQAFLGIRVQCAHCHNHPFEKWTQNDYFRMANLFARIGRKDKDVEETIFASDTGDVAHPKLKRPLPPAAFDGPMLALDAQGDRRVFLATWMTAADNPYFARALVNRVWKRFMGRGLVEPVDDMRLTNPASNEPLLHALTQDFVAHHFDMRALMRTIMQSKAYQRSSGPNATNILDDRFYSRCLPRRLTGEALLDAICQVTEQPEKYANMPRGTRAQGLPDTRVASDFLDAFGRPPRQVTCECERNGEPSVAQALNLINAHTLNTKIAAPAGVLDRLLNAKRSEREITEELYLTCLCRLPTPEEARLVPQALNAVSAISTASPEQARVTRRQVFGDLLWALINGPEFQFNH